MMFHIGYKSPFDIPELKNRTIKYYIKGAVESDQFYVHPSIITQINEMGKTKKDCAIIVTNLIRLIDKFGSHPIPVYRSLLILLILLRKGNKLFTLVSRIFIQEIYTVLILTFGTEKVTFRDQIHFMTYKIYNFLMFKTDLPSPDDIEISTKPNFIPKFQFNKDANEKTKFYENHLINNINQITTKSESDFIISQNDETSRSKEFSSSFNEQEEITENTYELKLDTELVMIKTTQYDYLIDTF